MLWDNIRDFFVRYIFGGTLSTGNIAGGVFAQDYFSEDTMMSYNTLIKLDKWVLYDTADFENPFVFISVGDWLSTTATIICMVLISICFILLVKWIFKAVTSAFLLK